MPTATRLTPHLVATDDEVKLRLHDLNSRRDVAKLLEVQYSFLCSVLYGKKERGAYTAFEIPRKSGAPRKIHRPPPNLAILQRKLLHALSLVYTPRECVHGFVRDRSVLTNAASHGRKRWILNIDLSDFFEHVTLGRIAGALRNAPFSFGAEAATVVAQICTRADGKLPQGSATSPLLANVVAYDLDRRLIAIAKSNHCQYSRYADDITLSTSKPLFPSHLAILHGQTTLLGDALKQSIEDAGFVVNEKKVRLLSKKVRQEITGLTVNEFANVARSYVREIRTVLHLAKKLGPAQACAWLSNKKNRQMDAASYVRGKLSYLSMIRSVHDPIVRRLALGFEQVFGARSVRIPSISELQPQPLRGHSRHFSDWSAVYKRISGAVHHMEVTLPSLEKASATAFSFHRGLYVTAGHNIGNGNIVAIELRGDWHVPRESWHQNDAHGPDLGIFRAGENVNASTYFCTQDRLPEIGEAVAAIGFPTQPLRQPEKSISIGYVESLPTNYPNTTRFIQVSFQSGGGLSGGPLVDRAGYVLGIMVENVGRVTEPLQIPSRTYAQAIPIAYLRDALVAAGFWPLAEVG